MPRRLLSWLLVWLALVVPALAQSNGSLLGLNVGAPPISSGATYTGPGDVVSGATAWYGLRAYNAAYAATPGLAVNVRRASDNVACDFNVTTAGGFGVTTATCNSSTQGGVSFGTFVGSDGTASCTLAGTTGACTGASGTVHVNDVVTGTGLTQPCIVASASNTAPTIEIAGTTTSCGTVSVAETFTFQVAGFGTEAYDQTGNARHATQATAGSQPQFLPSCFGSSSLPCLWFNGAGPNSLSATIPAVPQPDSCSFVFQGFSTGTNSSTPLATFNSGNDQEILSKNVSTMGIQLYAGTLTSAVSISAVTNYAIQALFSGAASKVGVNGAVTTGLSAGAAATNTTLVIGNRPAGSTPAYMYFTEGGLWPSDTSASWATLNSNERTYWNF